MATSQHPSNPENQNDFQKVIAYTIAEAINSGKFKSKNWEDKHLDIAFPPTPKLDDIVGYATTLDGQDLLIKHGTGSYNHIYVDETRGFESANALSGLRTVFNTKAQELNIPLRLYLLGMTSRSCDVTGGLITTFEYHNLFIDLKQRPQPKIKPEDTLGGIKPPSFLYLNKSNLALPFHGCSKPEDTLSTTIEQLSRGYQQLLQLEHKCNPPRETEIPMG